MSAAEIIDIPGETTTPMMQSTVSGDAAPVKLSFAPNWPVRVVMFRIIGTALILSAAGMWVLPGSVQAGDLVLLKLGISIFFFFCGLALLMRNHEDTQPDAFFDPIRKEVRVLQKNDQGQPQSILRRSYDSLGRADFSSNAVEFFDTNGGMIMRLLIDDAAVRTALKAQLTGHIALKGA